VSGLGPRSPHVGAALALGTAAAALAAMPDVRRVAEGVSSPGAAWVGLAGSTALVLGPLLVLVRAAPVRSRGFRAVLLGAAFAAVPVALLGRLLKTGTHHRPLGAATFGALALFVVLGAVFLGARFGAWLERGESTARRIAFGAATAAALAGVAFVVLKALGSEGMHHGVIDALRLLAAAALARMALDQPRVETWARRAGAFAWLVMVAGGMIAARGPLGDSIRERAPVLGGPLAWL
jgi:hypothetical protein